MVITAWILLVLSVFQVIKYFVTKAHVDKINSKSIIQTYYVKKHVVVIYYVSLVLIAVCLGIIFG